MVVFLGELLGTMLMMLLGNGVVMNVLLEESKGKNSGWIVSTAAWGFAVMVAVYSVEWMSGAHLNPAVTLALSLIGKSPWPLLPFYFEGQLIGAMIGTTLAWIVYFPHFQKTKNQHHKLLCFCTAPAIRSFFWNFMTEVIATSILVLGFLGIFDTHNQIVQWAKPCLIGALVVGIGLSLGGPTGFAINPARDLGPRILHYILPISGKGSSDWKYCWIPIFGPFAGGMIGAFAYDVLFDFVKNLNVNL